MTSLMNSVQTNGTISLPLHKRDLDLQTRGTHRKSDSVRKFVHKYFYLFLEKPGKLGLVCIVLLFYLYRAECNLSTYRVRAL